MMKDIIIFGCTVFTRQLLYNMEKEHGIPIKGFCVDREYYYESLYCEKPVYVFESLGNVFNRETFEVLIAVGYKGMNELRKRVFEDCETLGYAIGSYIQPDIRFEPERIGRGNIIADESRVFPYAVIGDGNIIVNSVITHDSIIGDFNFISSATIGGCAHIDNNCFIGLGACVGDNVHVGSKSLIGGGVFLPNDVESNTLVSPATPRIVKMRSDVLGQLFK